MSEPPDDVEAFLDANQRALSRLAMALTLDVHEAEELLQQTLIRVYEKWDQVSEAESPSAYVRRIMVNTNIREARRRSRRAALSRRLSTARHLAPRWESDGDLGRLEMRLALGRALSHLSERQRAAITLRFLEDLSDRDIAAVLGCREPTVRSLVKRGLDTLRLQHHVRADMIGKAIDHDH